MLGLICRFDIQNTLPLAEHHHQFCSLWDQLVDTAQNNLYPHVTSLCTMSSRVFVGHIGVISALLRDTLFYHLDALYRCDPWHGRTDCYYEPSRPFTTQAILSTPPGTHVHSRDTASIPQASGERVNTQGISITVCTPESFDIPTAALAHPGQHHPCPVRRCQRWLYLMPTVLLGDPHAQLS